MNNSVTCIICPLGCEIHLEERKNKYLFSGNLCSKGEDYAIREIKNPVRIVTTTVMIENSKNRLLPVRSRKGIKKDLVMKCILLLSKLKVKAPIRCGDIVYRNILNTGIDIIASRDIKENKLDN